MVFMVKLNKSIHIKIIDIRKVKHRENLNVREGQSETHVDKYSFNKTTKGFRCYQQFNNRGPL